jgi:hypothetical protein
MLGDELVAVVCVLGASVGQVLGLRRRRELDRGGFADWIALGEPLKNISERQSREAGDQGNGLKSRGSAGMHKCFHQMLEVSLR